MARRAALVAIMAVVGIGVSAGTSSGQLLDLGGGHIDLPGGGGITLPGNGSGGGIDLPGGGGIDLPGGDNGGGGVELPGGGGIDLPGGGGSVPPPEPTPTPPPPDGGDVSEGTGGSGGGGSGGRGGGGGGRPGGRGDRGRNGANGTGGTRAARQAIPEPPIRAPDGTPTDANPTLTIADFGPAPIGVPNFVIDQFTIPPFLLPIYQACGTQYDIPWQVLASINRIETAFGTNLNVSTAGALGWMQFMPSTWRAYGVDANEDGRKDPYNPVDGICAAARYLRAAGGQEDLRSAIFAYNHADWYVDEVLLYAREYGALPDDLVGSLTGLTEGARFPVAADSRYADDISERQAEKRSQPSKGAAGNAADVVSTSPTRRGINIYSRDGAPVIAVNDGVVTETGHTDELGRYLVLRDAYGNRYTYAQLAQVADLYPVPKERPSGQPSGGNAEREEAARGREDPSTASGPVNTENARPRLAALPDRSDTADWTRLTDPGDQMLQDAGFESFKLHFGALRFKPDEVEMRPLQEGSKVIAGTVLGRVGKTDRLAPHVHFAIQPSGRGAPTIDPKPILDGWKLLEATHIYRASGKDPFEASAATAGQVLLLSKDQATRQLLSDPGVGIYECGRQDIRTGQIDSRILRLLLYLSARGFDLTVTSLKCGHSTYTTSGNISEHSSGNAVDIAQINGLPVLGNQGAGSLTEALVKDTMQLQGSMSPHQIISLMNFGANTYAMSDHDDHVHVGYQPLYGPGAGAGSPQFTRILKADQWRRLIDRISRIENPDVPTTPSPFALRGKRAGGDRASVAHTGE